MSWIALHQRNLHGRYTDKVINEMDPPFSQDTVTPQVLCELRADKARAEGQEEKPLFEPEPTTAAGPPPTWESPEAENEGFIGVTSPWVCVDWSKNSFSA